MEALDLLRKKAASFDRILPAAEALRIAAENMRAETGPCEYTVERWGKAANDLGVALIAYKTAKEI